MSHWPVIHKYTIPVLDESEQYLPEGSKILSVGVQDGGIRLWALVNTDAERELRHFEVIGTGNPIGPHRYHRHFLGTVHIPPFVWHVFELNDEEEGGIRIDR